MISNYSVEMMKKKIIIIMKKAIQEEKMFNEKISNEILMFLIE